MIPRLLSIAGSDPSGGAGIQMDLKVFSTLNAYGMAVPTSLTVQNTKGVYDVFLLPTDIIKKQITCVLKDIRVDGIKIGMLGNAEKALLIRDILREVDCPIVFDPVLKSTTGSELTTGELQKILKLAEICAVITPNTQELLALTGQKKITTAIEELRKQNLRCAVIVTGADAPEKEVTDWIFTDDKAISFSHPKINLPAGTHGTGCAFSSALTYYLSIGNSVIEAYKKARDFVVTGLKKAIAVGGGIIPVRPEANTDKDALRYRVLKNLSEAVEQLKALPDIGLLIPEVQSNLAEAIPNPQGIEDVAAFPGRIIRYKRGIATVGCPEFGASSHVARIVLTANKFDPEIRACMNIKYKKEWIEKLKQYFNVSSFDRKKEPEEVKVKEGKTLDWGTEAAIKKFGDKIPDIIYDEGDVGKEPMIRVLGTNALDVVTKIENILKILKNKL
ncbi:bifunctional hydroxymethylpyrimidine kinase/phosphomethylpyrimidine kinase [Thermosulfidibacter takaii]|nr:bifunctional hydroxymethylpyrimidine kinase/phosphomethylpyrimidine kinase [Thermosulfidibacter takaii]